MSHCSPAVMVKSASSFFDFSISSIFSSKVPRVMRRWKKYGIDDNTIKDVLGNLLKYSVLVADLPDVKEIADDPADDKVLATAVAGRAETIVTGDSHLLKLSQYRNIEIVTPGAFSTMMRF